MIPSLFSNNEASENFRDVRKAVRCTLGFDYHDVQIRGGNALLKPNIVEMETGEGKTVTAVLALTLLARNGQGVLLATANDYLAYRDADWMQPVFNKLHLSVGCIQEGMSRSERKEQYDRDITYGTIREFGFDHLKDRLAERQAISSVLSHDPGQFVKRVQRDPYAIIVDEADSILIDEATMPLVISGQEANIPNEANTTCYRWAVEVAGQLNEFQHYHRLPDSNTIVMTDVGTADICKMNMPPEMSSLTLTEILHKIEIGLYAKHTIHRNQQYVVQEEKVIIVDEYTGRKSPGRAWEGGIHQAIEAREGLSLTPETAPIANISVKEFINRFPRLSGMTGTARESRHEFSKVYKTDVVEIPPHRTRIRKILPAAICDSIEHKWGLIMQEVLEVRESGRPVLIGIRTIEQSERLSEILSNTNIDHRVLNAQNHKLEAEIIAEAGLSGRVTVATNMAGRGTDIQLNNAARQAGGLHVIGVELHAASRIDRQLAGRSGRQGDPGTFRQYISPEDEILQTAYGPEFSDRQRAFLRKQQNPTLIERAIRKAQRIVERRQYKDRLFHSQRNQELNGDYASLGLDPVLDKIPSE